MVEVLWIYPPPTPVRMVCMVRLAVEELIERLDITMEVLKKSDTAGVESLVEAVALCKDILRHYVKPFTLQTIDELNQSMTEMDRP